MQGSIVGSRYQIIKCIAKSRFGETYLAEDTQLANQKKCLVKQLYLSLNDPNFIKVANRLLRTEAKTLNQLKLDRQIPQLLSYFEENDKFYLVQQYTESHIPSKKLISKEPQSPTNFLVELLQDCASILNFIDAKQAVHQDVKSANLTRRHLNSKWVLVDLDTAKEIISTLAGLGIILKAISQTESDLDTSTDKPSSSTNLSGESQITSLSPVKRTNNSIKEQRQQAFYALKQTAKNSIKKWLTQQEYDLLPNSSEPKIGKKINTEYNKFTKPFYEDLIETIQTNRSDVREQIAQIDPQWNSLEHRTQKINSKNLSWHNRNQKITEHFTVGELIGNSKPPTTAEEKENLIKVAQLAQKIRNKWGSGIVINSGYRDPEHNKRVGGVKNSQHVLGNALDIRPANGKIHEFHAWLYKHRDEFGIGGFGHGHHKGFVHVDLGDRREWGY